MLFSNVKEEKGIIEFRNIFFYIIDLSFNYWCFFYLIDFYFGFYLMIWMEVFVVGRKIVFSFVFYLDKVDFIFYFGVKGK